MVRGRKDGLQVIKTGLHEEHPSEREVLDFSESFDESVVSDPIFLEDFEDETLGLCDSSDGSVDDDWHLSSETETEHVHRNTREISESKEDTDEKYWAKKILKNRIKTDDEQRDPVLDYKNNFLYRLSLIKSDEKTDEVNMKKEFYSVLYHIYPDTYVKRFDEILCKKKTDNEKRVLESIVSMPVCCKVEFNEQSVFELLNCMSYNPTLKGLCEGVVGYLEQIASFGEIVLKDFEQNSILNSIPRVALLLVGERGTGKTWFARAISHFLGLPCLHIDCANTDFMTLVGSCQNWGNSAEGILARFLIQHQKFPVVVTFDEVDKGGKACDHKLVDCISHILDDTKTFMDEFLQVPLYHYRISIFVLTANDENSVPAYLKSRAIVVEVPTLPANIRTEIALSEFKKLLQSQKSMLTEEEVKMIIEDKTFHERVTTIVEAKKLDIRNLIKKLNFGYFRYNHIKKYDKKAKLTDIILQTLDDNMKSSDGMFPLFEFENLKH